MKWSCLWTGKMGNGKRRKITDRSWEPGWTKVDEPNGDKPAGGGRQISAEVFHEEKVVQKFGLASFVWRANPDEAETGARSNMRLEDAQQVEFGWQKKKTKRPVKPVRERERENRREKMAQVNWPQPAERKAPAGVASGDLAPERQTTRRNPVR